METFQHNDGGRKEAGFKGDTGDCVCRSIAIATEKPYKEIYDALNKLATGMRQTKKAQKSRARTGVYRTIYQKYLESIGWKWTPIMTIGAGCKVHLREDELPKGRIIARVSKHLCAVVDGVVHDTHDCSRGGSRCVYGYFSKK
jgi:hypothetical protein